MQKEVERILRRLKKVKGMTDEERLFWAWSFARLPLQRWEFNMGVLKFYDSFSAPVFVKLRDGVFVVNVWNRFRTKKTMTS